MDVTGGLDLAYCTKAMEKGEAKASDGETYKAATDRKTIDLDFRPRLQVAASYKRNGIYAGYSFGLVDYKSGYRGGVANNAYSRLFRFGLTWRLR